MRFEYYAKGNSNRILPTATNSHTRRGLIKLAVLVGYLTAIFGGQGTVRAQDDQLRQHYTAAGTFLGRGDQQHAEEEYKAFLAEALHLVANADAQITQTLKARELFAEALEFGGRSSALLDDYAALSFDQGQLAEAETLLDSALEIDPNDVRAHLLLGRVHFNAEKYLAARPHCEFVLSHGDVREVWYLLGVTDLKLQQLTAAQDLFSKVVRILGDKPSTHFRIGLAYNTGDYPDQAIVEFKKAIASDPKALDQHYYLGLAYLGHNPEAGFAKAEPEFRAELSLSPNDFRSYYMLGYIALKQRNMTEAEVELARALSLKPEDVGTLLSMSELYTDDGRDSEAEPLLRKAIDFAGKTSAVNYEIVRAHYMLGRILQRTGREDEGKKELTASEDLRLRLRAESGGASKPGEAPKPKEISEDAGRKPVSPEDRARAEAFVRELASPIAESFYNLGAIAANRQECPACVSHFRRAAEWNSSLQSLDRNLGRAEFLCKDYGEAIAPLSRYLDEHADDDTVRSELGLSFFRIGRYQEVVRVLDPIKSAFATNPELAQAYTTSMAKLDRK